MEIMVNCVPGTQLTINSEQFLSAVLSPPQRRLLVRRRAGCPPHVGQIDQTLCVLANQAPLSLACEIGFPCSLKINRSRSGRQRYLGERYCERTNPDAEMINVNRIGCAPIGYKFDRLQLGLVERRPILGPKIVPVTSMAVTYSRIPRQPSVSRFSSGRVLSLFTGNTHESRESYDGKRAGS